MQKLFQKTLYVIKLKVDFMDYIYSSQSRQIHRSQFCIYQRNNLNPILLPMNFKSLSQSSRPQPSPQRNLNPELEFEKNYPKNVFIPLIEYLAEKGYKQAYEECVGTREDIQRKNVVSLDMIFKLTREPWFERNINKNQVVINISNKILMNSKIKKKLFHLLIAQQILLQDSSTQIKQFKKNISKMANNIASQNLPSDQLFSHPNSIIYLLTMFLRIFRHSLQSKGIDRLEQQLDNLKIQQQACDGNRFKSLGSKEQYKYLVKQIVQLFGKRNLSMNQLTDAFEQIKNTILCRAYQIREQYHFIQKIPNWQMFVQLVVTRCFQSRRKDGKITNMIFNQWITEYKNRSVSVEGRVEVMESKFQAVDYLTFQEKIGGPSVRKFSPIILTKNY